MQTGSANLRLSDAAMETFFLGELDFDAALALQQRLVYEAGGQPDGRISVIVCEHRPIITLGRLGSRTHIRLSPQQLASRKLEVRWTNRGGGCLLHLPGQLAVYPIVPLRLHGWTVGDYLRRLHTGLVAALESLKVPCETRPGSFGVWGRTGQLAVVATAVKNWTTYHGAYLNVSPALREFRGLETDPEHGTLMSSLVVERQQAVRMATVRAAIVDELARAFDCTRSHLHTGHPLLQQLKSTRKKLA